jgi:hypothetical protein
MQTVDVHEVGFAPLQRLMLRDRWVGGGVDAHLERVEIHFSGFPAAEEIRDAWERTVAATEALRMGFVRDGSEAVGWREVKEEGGRIHIEDGLAAECGEGEAIHQRLSDGLAPWVVCYWPGARRLVWTFHHALLDGRSMARVLRVFFQCLRGQQVVPLSLVSWREPTAAEIRAAERIFQETRGHLRKYPAMLTTDDDSGPALSRLGAEVLQRLERLAEHLDLSPATLVIWAWGQALAEKLTLDSVVVEQVRCGFPRESGAGFSMTTLPLVIPRWVEGGLACHLQDFRRRLLALREIDTVSSRDFQDRVYPDVDGVGCSMVMVEDGTLRHRIGEEVCDGWIREVELHEPVSDVLAACAYLQPALQLRVEGPGCCEMLGRWERVIGNLSREYGMGWDRLYERMISRLG